MTESTQPRLTFGYHIPEGVTTAWGARLIAPNDLVWDRQDVVSDDPAAKEALITWLNGVPSGSGAIKKMLDALAPMRYTMPEGEFVPFEDETGKLLANTNGRSGYVYVVGWLK